MRVQGGGVPVPRGGERRGEGGPVVWGGGWAADSQRRRRIARKSDKTKAATFFFSFLFFCDFYLFRFYESLTCDIDLLDSLVRLRS